MKGLIEKVNETKHKNTMNVVFGMDKQGNVTAKPITKLTLKDFTKYMNERYGEL